MKSLIIKSEIIKQGYTIRDVSLILNINEQTITNWINGRNLSNIIKFLQLLNLLNIKIKDLDI